MLTHDQRIFFSWNWDEMMAKYSDDYERMGPILRFVHRFFPSDEIVICRVKFRIIDRELIKEDGTRGVVRLLVHFPLCCPFNGKIKGVVVNCTLQSRDRTFTNKRSISEEGQSSNPRKEKIPRGFR